MKQLLWKLRYERQWRIQRATERVVHAIVWRLPRQVVYWAAIRVIAHATQGPYSSQNVPELRAMDALQRWDRA